MKSTARWFLVGLLFLCGCHTRYDITLRSGNKITALGRPVYDKENAVYHYRDAKGEMHAISILRVREIDARSIFKRSD